MVAGADAQGRVAGERIFDGKTLDGWVDIENNATSLAVDGVRDAAALASRLVSGTDAVSVMLRTKLEPLVKVDLAAYSAGNANAKVLVAATVKDINAVIAGPLTMTRRESAALRCARRHGRCCRRECAGRAWLG